SAAIATEGEIVDFSPDGKRLLIQVRSPGLEAAALEVWSIEGDKAQRMVSFRPYEDHEQCPLYFTAGREPTWARFVDDEHVLTRNWTGQIVLWDVSKLRA